MRFVPIDQVDKEEPKGFTFVPLDQAEAPQEAKGLTFVPLEQAEKPVPEESTLSPEFAQALAPVVDTARPVAPVAPFAPVAQPVVEAPTGPVTTNPLKGLGARAVTLLGSGIEGVARVGESFGDYLEEKLPVSGLSKEELQSKRQLEPLFNWADSLKNYGKEINYQPSQKLGDIADNPVTIIPFIAERIISSSPDMAAAVLAFPAYISARTNEILNERLKNDQKELKDATVGDVATAAGAAVIEGTLERFATRGLGRATTAATGAKRVGKETAIQSGTEAVEEGVSYLGGTAGTKAGVDVRELGAQMLEGAIVGGGLGAGVQAGKEGYQVYQQRAADNDYKNAMATILEDKGFSFAPPEVQQEIQQEATRSILESAKENLGSVVDSIKERITDLTTPQTPETDEYKALVSRYRSTGLTYDEAVAQATQDFVEAGRGDQLDPRTGKPGISMPSEQLETAAGAPAVIPGGVGGAGTPTAIVGGRETTGPGALKDLGSPESQKIQDSASTMAHTLFNPNNVRTDGRPGWEKPPKEREPLINAFEMGSLDARGDFFHPENYKNKKEKQAYELGHKYATGLMTGAPVDIASEAAKLVATKPPVTQGKPRGRPKAELTEDEIVARAEARKAQQAAGKQVIRSAEKLQKISQEQFDPTKFETAEDLAEGERGFAERRRQALEDAYALTVQGATKNNKAGTIGQAILESATPQEREIARQRYELRKGTARSELLEATNQEENQEYTRFDNAGTALNWIARNGNAFEKVLAKRLLPFVRNMKVVIVRSPADLPSDYLRSQFDEAAGMYSDGVIYLDAEGGLNNTVFLHEALHGATIARINKYLDDIAAGIEPEASLAEAVEQLNSVMKSANRIYTVLKQRGMTDARTDALARAGAFTDMKEFIAYGMSNPAMQEFLLQAPGMVTGVKSTVFDKLFTPFVQAIRKILKMGEGEDSALQDLIIVTDKLLSAKFAGPKVTKSEAALAKKQSKQIDKDENAIRQSKSSTETEKLVGDMIKNHGFEGIKDLLDARLDALGNNFISKLLYNMPTSDILRWKGDEIPALVSTDKMMQEISAMRMRLLTSVAKKAEDLAKFINKNGSEALSDTMHLARLKKVSPAKYPTAAEYIKNDPLVKKYEQIIADPATDPTKLAAFKGQLTQRENQINAVYARWDALGKQKGGHDMYRMAQEYYQDMYNLTRRLLDDQINQLPIDAAAKAKLLKSVRLMHERSVSNKEVETVTLDDGTESIEATFASLPEDYFPFTRRGQYWLNVQGPKGREFYLFESGVDRNVFKAKRAREMGVDKNDSKFFNQGDNIQAFRQSFQDSSMMLSEMFKAIDEADTTKAPADFADGLKDQIYQIYLMSMPERSFRKQFLHADKITGFSSDILRNLKDSGSKYANQLAKLKYGASLRNEIQRARDTLEGMPSDERGRLELFVNEMSERAEMEINPPEDNPWVTKINQVSYLMLLTSAATAGVQMLSVPNMVMPTLVDQYGYTKAIAKFGKYMSLWKSVGITNTDPDTGETTYTAPSFVSSEIARSNQNLRRAYQYAIDHYNMFSLTNTSVLTGAAKTPTAVGEGTFNRGAQTTYRIITALLNGSERISREIAFGMTFELEYEKTKDFDQAVKKAVESTQELLGRYDAAQRPRSWRNAIGRTVGQFKMYSAFMTSWFLRNGYTAITKGMLEAEGRSAMQKLSGVILMGAMFHGLVGSPLYSTIASLVDYYDYLFGDEDEMRRRKAINPLTAYDADMRFRYEFLPKNFGQIKIPGLDGRDHRLSEVLEKGPASVLTDINIGSRTSYDGLWFREAKVANTTKETILNFLAANLGPSISVGGNFLGAIDDFADGKIQRGLEKVAPAFFKAPLVAARLSEEGAKSQAGDMLLNKREISNLNIAAQALGFQPTRLTRIQETNFKLSQEDKKATAQRQELLKRLNEAVSGGEPPQKFREIFKDIAKHNRRFPHEAYEIDDETLDRSLETYSRRKELIIRGMYVPEKKEDILIPITRTAQPLK